MMLWNSCPIALLTSLYVEGSLKQSGKAPREGLSGATADEMGAMQQRAGASAARSASPF
jgi:hypothetical protein